MSVDIWWRSEQGKLTADNRDHCGIGLRDDAALCIVLDGSTSGANSGEFARLIAQNLVDWFVVAADISPTAIVHRLRHIHAELTIDFRRDSASFIIALIQNDGEVHLLHAGDCLAGIHGGVATTEWVVRPHTLANAIVDVSVADISVSPLRNRLTRSFRSRKFVMPDQTEAGVRGDVAVLLATDGFWAALDAEDQARFLKGEDLPDVEGRDDCSVLSLKHTGTHQNWVGGESADNFYIVAHS